MHYFSKVKVDDEVYSLIYGKGNVVFALPKKNRLDGFYVFAVEYKNKQTVHYTVDGIPNWCSTEDDCQTVYYLKDVDLTDMDIQPASKILSQKQISKFQEKGILEIRCPSGIWRNAGTVPQKLVKKALKKDKYYLFRKERD